MKFLTLASIVATCGLASAASTSVTLYNWCGAGTVSAPCFSFRLPYRHSLRLFLAVELLLKEHLLSMDEQTLPPIFRLETAFLTVETALRLTLI